MRSLGPKDNKTMGLPMIPELKELAVWELEYSLEVNIEGDRQTHEGYECTVLSTNDLEDAMRKVREIWIGRKITVRIEDDDGDEDEVSYTVAGVRFTQANILTHLTDFDKETE